MNRLTATLLAAGLIGASVSASAADNLKLDNKMMKGSMNMSKDMKAMDANGDGMISKDEYMKHYETMYEGMQKNKDGMVDMKHVSMMKGASMKGHTMAKGDSMMKSDSVMKSTPMMKSEPMMKSDTAMKSDTMAPGGAMMKSEPMMKGDMNMKGGAMMKGEAPKSDGTMTKDGIKTGQKAPN